MRVLRRSSKAVLASFTPCPAVAVRAAALLTFLLLVLLRLPEVSEHGRFWAEEGRLYFQDAWVLPWWRVILRPENGYLSLYANVAALLARYCVPLGQAPRLTTAAALLAQCFPILVLITARDRWLRPAPISYQPALRLTLRQVSNAFFFEKKQKTFGPAVADLSVSRRQGEKVFWSFFSKKDCLLSMCHSQRRSVLLPAVLLVAMPPLCDEVWLNTANSQFHIALAAALCLALEAPSGWSGRLRRVLLFFAPLCGPITVALTPLFVLRAVRDRQRARALQAACLLAGALPQLAIMALAPMHERGKFIGPTTITCIFAAKHLAIPFLGEDLANSMVPAWRMAVQTGHVPWAPVLTVGVAGAALVWAVALGRRADACYLLGCGLALSVLSYNGAVAGGISLITVEGGQRYAFAPSMLFALTVTSLCTVANRWVAHGAKIVLAWLLAVSVWQTIPPQDPVYSQGPLWELEVARLRKDPAYAPRIWPDGWRVKL